MSHHTPGPWAVQGDCVVADGFTVCHFNEADAEARPLEAAANLALMAKSPDMLTALESIIKAYKACDSCDYLADLFDTITNAEDVISKAKGL